jgi:hypothetical protein
MEHTVASCGSRTRHAHDAVAPPDSSNRCPEGPYHTPAPAAPICARRARPWPRPRPRSRQRAHGGESSLTPLRYTREHTCHVRGCWLTQLACRTASGSQLRPSPLRGLSTSFPATAATTPSPSLPASSTHTQRRRRSGRREMIYTCA